MDASAGVIEKEEERVVSRALGRVLLFSLAEEVASTRGLTFTSYVVDKVDPVELSPRIRDLIRVECERLGYSWINLPSGAGHDGQIISGKAESGMIFIPSVDGNSHSPQEMIQWEDFEKGANILLQVILRLAG